MLDELRPAFASLQVTLAATAAGGAVVAVIACLCGRTVAGVITMASVLSLYGLVLNGPEMLMRSLMPEDSSAPRVRYVIDVRAGNVQGAELHVNGVYLGRTPVVTTLSEFVEKVPFWPEPPRGLAEETDVVEKIEYGSHGRHVRERSTWIPFSLPGGPGKRRHDAPEDDEAERTYYARVRLGDEWGLDGGGRSGGGGGGRYTYQAHSFLEAEFPERDRRLERLLDQARLADYRAGEEWFAAMETYREDGWIAIRRAAETEPSFRQVLDDWARWRYGFGAEPDAESARSVFQHICEEADERECYFTPSVAGRAVELLVPHLDPEPLVREAEELIRSVGTYGWWTWFSEEGAEFGMSYRPGGFDNGTGYLMTHWTGSSRPGRAPVHAYVVAHAIWVLDQLLDERDDAEPNLVERRIPPALVGWHWDDGSEAALRIASALSGPAIDHFLIRKNRRVEVAAESFHDRAFAIPGRDINRWLYLAANLESEAGREFRSRHSRAMLELADALSVREFGERGLWVDSLFGFLFLDLDRHEQSLAFRYWPTFRARTAELSDRLELCWRYLARMEPLATPQMYLDCWRSTRTDSSFFSEAIEEVLPLLPLAERRDVVDALRREVEKDVGNMTDVDSPADEASRRRWILRELDEALLEDPDRALAEVYLAQLTGKSDPKRELATAEWLEHTRPDHPLVEMLAGAAEARLRRLALGALRAQPTPAHREILERLLEDPDDSVRGAAEEVKEALADLAAAPPRRYLSPGALTSGVASPRS